MAEPSSCQVCTFHPGVTAQARRLVKNSIISIDAPEVELPEEDEFDEVAAATADVEAFRAAEGTPGDVGAGEPAAAAGKISMHPDSQAETAWR